ncbi:MAG: CvpA family protein [Eubacteriales bacterium]|nr:CvpA family protein [Eubacteriales bacterium]
MKTVNPADVLGILFLGYGLLDGYRKGLVKKGTALLVSLATLLAVYAASPYVEAFLRQILPDFLSLEQAGTDSELYRMLVLSGFREQAEEYVQILAARVIALVLTYAVVRLILRTAVLSLEILTKVPGLSLLNRLAGAAFGLTQQLVTLWILFLIVAIFSASAWGSVLYETIQSSAWMSGLYENNLLLLFGILFILKI